MITNKSRIFWKTNIETEKKEIVKGFKDLYQHNQDKEKIPHNKILELMILNMNIFYLIKKYTLKLLHHLPQNQMQRI